MPKYYIYKRKTGEVINVHETYDVVGGNTVTCTREELLSMIDDSNLEKDLETLKVESENYPISGTIRVDTSTKTLVQE